MNDFGILVAQHNTSLPTLADGAVSELQVDSNGRLLVQADVTVVMDFLGLNGAGDSSNALIVGTEDGTSSGTAHAVRLATNGAVVIDDGGSSITVDATDLDIRDLSHTQDSVQVGDGTDLLAVNADGSINITDNGGSLTVDATDLDIRDLSASQDNVAISDGTDQLEINSDGSINSFEQVEGSESYSISDDLAAGGDGIIGAVGTTYVDMFSQAVASGETAYVYGWQFACDKNAQARILVDDGTNTFTYKVAVNSSAMPSYAEHFSDYGRIEIAGGATTVIKVQVKLRSGSNGNATGSAHIRIV